MRLLLNKDESMENVIYSIANRIDDEWFYIPGWFQKHENGEIEFHNIHNLPEELTKKLEEIQEAQKEQLAAKKEELKEVKDQLDKKSKK